ncbi:MAG: T9SS type A sorting domain-containing protein [Bacteroidia bacterium]
MKKTILSLLCCALISVVHAQIPNSSFENWTTIGSYSNPDGWGTMNNTTNQAGIYTATKGTPGNPGASYLKLTSRTVSTTIVNGIAVSGQLDSITMQPKSGFAFNMRPASFNGRWQHMIYGSSQGSILVTLTRWDTGLNQRIAVGSASVTLSGMVMNWANFSLPFNYIDGGYPDTCIIILKASGSNPTDLDYLWVDNLAFSGSVTSIENNNSLSNNLSVFPNPCNNHVIVTFNIKETQQTTINITNINGKIILSKNVDFKHGEMSQTIDISSLSAGIYFLKVISESGTAVKKIVVE